jgi:hypothetical protein
MNSITGDNDDEQRYGPRHASRRAEDRELYDLIAQNKRGVNWAAVGWATTIAIWLLGIAGGWFGTNADEVRLINQRLVALESQRREDVGRMERIERSSERVEGKVDRLLERVTK